MYTLLRPSYGVFVSVVDIIFEWISLRPYITVRHSLSGCPVQSTFRAFSERPHVRKFHHDHSLSLAFKDGWHYVTVCLDVLYRAHSGLFQRDHMFGSFTMTTLSPWPLKMADIMSQFVWMSCTEHIQGFFRETTCLEVSPWPLSLLGL